MKHILQDLIQIPSVSGEEAEIQDFIHAWLTNLGFEPMWVEQNILVKIKGTDSTKAVILNAHVDTVAAGEKDQWQYSPYSGHIDADKKIYGLGASDEKAGVAALLLFAQTLLQQPPACDIRLTFVVREELDGLATQQTIDWFEQQYRSQYQHLAAILAEPTRLERIEIGHRGNVFIQLEIQGEGGHGS